MSDDQPNPFSQSDQPLQPSGQEPGTFSQKFSHAPVSARVPERIGRGVFTTGVCIQDTPTEFILDFLQALSQPRAIVSRVVLAPAVMGGLVNTLRERLNVFTQTFGPPAPLPKPPPTKPPTILEIYENFKLPEELYSGTYANSYMVAFGPSEFGIDFITGFYPTAAVSNRIYFSAQQLPRMLDALGAAMQQHQLRYQQPPPPRNQAE